MVQCTVAATEGGDDFIGPFLDDFGVASFGLWGRFGVNGGGEFEPALAGAGLAGFVFFVHSVEEHADENGAKDLRKNEPLEAGIRSEQVLAFGFVPIELEDGATAPSNAPDLIAQVANETDGQERLAVLRIG